MGVHVEEGCGECFSFLRKRARIGADVGERAVVSHREHGVLDRAYIGKERARGESCDHRGENRVHLSLILGV